MRTLRRWANLMTVAGTLCVWAGTTLAAEEPVLIPPPTVDESAGDRSTAVAVLAGGCFWGVQGVFQHVEGVLQAVSGYAGGQEQSANYEAVSSGDTEHAESVRITYDPARVTFGKLLQIYFSVAHDPTQLNRQGPDRGTQYRSTIFAMDDEQHRIAEQYIAQLEHAGVYKDRIATTIEDDRGFYPAESYHQDYLVRNPTSAYIVINDIPKVKALKEAFPGVWRKNPVLVLSAARRINR